VNQVEFSRLPDDALIRLCTIQALALVPFSTSTLWRQCRIGAFPRPVRVSSQVTAWRVGEIREWLKDPSRFKSGSQPFRGAV